MHGAVKCRDGNCRREGAANFIFKRVRRRKIFSSQVHANSSSNFYRPPRGCRFFGAAKVTQAGLDRTASGGYLAPDIFLARCGFGGNALGDLYLRFALTLLNESGESTFHAQAYIPTQPAQAIKDTWISHAHEDPGRQEGNFPPARQGAQTGLCKTRIPRIIQWRGRGRPRIS